jgi:hypothetical protein
VADPVWAITALTALAFFLPSFFAGVPAPVLAQIAVTTQKDSGPALGAMFASGAVGAIAGTLLAGFVFIAWLGSTLTLVVVTLVYVASGLLCFWLGAVARAAAGRCRGRRCLGSCGLRAIGPPQCQVESRHFCLRVEVLSPDPVNPVRLMVIDHLAHGIGAAQMPKPSSPNTPRCWTRWPGCARRGPNSPASISAAAPIPSPAPSPRAAPGPSPWPRSTRR